MEGKILLARPRINQGQVYDQQVALYGIFADWAATRPRAGLREWRRPCCQGPRQPPRARKVLLDIRLFRNEFGGFGSDAGKGSTRCRFITAQSERLPLRTRPAETEWFLDSTPQPEEQRGRAAHSSKAASLRLPRSYGFLSEQTKTGL
jgi:hypothetical protein